MQFVQEMDNEEKTSLSHKASTHYIQIFQFTLKHSFFILRPGVRVRVRVRIDTVDHHSLIKKSFWKYAKEFIEKPREKLSSFNIHRCFSHFYQTFKPLCPRRFFLIPDWILRLPTPKIQFSTSPLTYREVTNTMRKMKTSGSPCPLNQISIIALKRSPYLTTYLTEIISQAWKGKTIPDTWEKAVTILIHKIDTKDESVSFSPNYALMYGLEGHGIIHEK